MQGLQCPKSLYLQVRRPEIRPEDNASQKARFAEGTEVGLVAQQHFPGGVLIDAPSWESDQAIRLTEEAIRRGADTIYEATFSHEGVLVKVDILHRPDTDAPWEIIEVKSSTSVKREHLVDVAIQSWALAGAGVRHASCSVMTINNRCVAPDLDDLFTRVDVTEEVRQLQKDLAPRIESLREVLRASEIPDVDIGPHCSSPYECPYAGHCWKEKSIPTPSVLDLPGIGAKAWKLYGQGIVSLNDPRLGELPLLATRMVEAARSGKRWVDGKSIAAQLKSWQWPLHFLDFETISPAVPKFAGTRPYQPIPFQFSCHLQLKLGGEVLHFEYLHDGSDDPRSALAEALVQSIGSTGSVVSYNKNFEGSCIQALAKLFPQHAPALLSIRARLVDPWPIVRSTVYDNAFNGRFGIKSVAPALLGEALSYSGLEVADGQMAQSAYARILDFATPQDEKNRLRAALLEYCKQDTLAMVFLVAWLHSQ